jgi:NAD(P)-dependent dehydrogenase (short-subunit alcohol dehydrogenase family)
MSFEKYNKIFSINVYSGFEIARIIAKKENFNSDNMSLVFIASIMGLVGNKALTGYSATKGALISGSKSMAVELAKKKIRVNCISPGFIETEMMNSVSKKFGKEQMDKLKSEYLLGLGKPKDVANACLFLLSDASRWITGINLPVDGGYTCK